MDAEVSKYTKALVALVAASVAAIASGVGNGTLGDLSTQDWVYILAVILGGSAATWFAENVLGVAGGIIKAFLSAATSGLAVLATGYEMDGAISQGELLAAVSAFLVALTLTYQIPNATPDRAAVVPTAVVSP